MAATSPLLPPQASSSAFFAPSVVEKSHMFHEHPTLAVASRVTLQSAGVGLLVSAVQNAMEKCVSIESSVDTVLARHRFAFMLSSVDWV
jgi:hypothetical protein